VSSTRDRILEEARGLVETSAEEPLNMSAIASRVGISRQALYLHFPDRAALLLALVEYTDDQESLAAGLTKVNRAPTGAEALRAFLEMQASRNPKIAPLARALHTARHRDPASAAAWRDRMAERLRGTTAIAVRLREERCLHPSWSIPEAAILLRELTSFRLWDDLVNDAGVKPDRYVELMLHTALRALQAPAPGSRSPNR
jgi:AcrR family transcriptional regulator